MSQTVYTLTKHCRYPGEVFASLTNIGLGKGAIISECLKIASVNGPRAQIYRDTVQILRLSKRNNETK